MNRTFSASLAALVTSLTFAVGLVHAPRSFAAETPYSSEEKARQALAVLQSDAPPQEKAVACKRLAVYGGPEAIPALAPLLGDDLLASWARIPLEVIPGPAADAALRSALGRLQGNLLVGVINSIGVRGDAQAVGSLQALLQHANDEVASAAAVALGKIGGSPATQALEAALVIAPSGSRSAVAEGLILCAERSSVSGQNGEAVRLYDSVRRAKLPKQRILEATRGSILARQNEGLPLLLETLRDTDPDVFSIGLRTARELPGQIVTEALASELNRVPAERQGAILLALTDRTDDAVGPAVFRSVTQGSKSLRMVALGALERQGNPASLPVLLEAVTDSDRDVSKAAKTALSRLPGKNVDAALLVKLPQATGAARRPLVELAGQRRVTALVPELFKAAQDSDPELRSAGFQALGETVALGDLDKLVHLLVQTSSEDELPDVEGALDTACARLSDKTAASEPLLARIPEASPATRCALLRVLGTVGTPKALKAVQSSLDHADTSVREAAFRVLADWPDAAALPALIEFIRTTQQDTQRTLALRGAVRLLGQGDSSAAQTLKTYRELLGLAGRVDDRKLILSGIGAVPDPAAVALVEPLLADATVRKEAESALLSIAGGLAGSSPTTAKALAGRLQQESADAATRDRATQLLQRLEKVEDFMTAWQFAGAYRLATGESQCAGYARTWVYSEQAQPARIEFGTDDGHKLWLNGERIAQADRGGSAVPGEFKTIVSLRQGWNTLLLKVVQDTGPWEFCLRLRSPGGEKLGGLRIQATPPDR